MMKLFYTIGLLLLLAYNSNHTHSTMLWEITGNGMKETSFLFGTFHIKDKVMNILPQALISRLHQSQRLYTEIPLSDKSTKDVLLYSKMKLPIPLQKRLHSKTIKILLSYLKEHRLPYTLETLEPFKTWAITLILFNARDESDALFMDETLVAFAKAKHIKRAALETAIEQLKYFNVLSPSMQEQFLLDTFTQNENTKYKNALHHWYREGNPEGFFEIQRHFTSTNPKQKKLDKILNKGLLIERNERLTRRINILLQNNSRLRYFFAIGAGHFSGEQGIIQKLRQLGYQIKKIN